MLVVAVPTPQRTQSVGAKIVTHPGAKGGAGNLRPPAGMYWGGRLWGKKAGSSLIH